MTRQEELRKMVAEATPGPWVDAGPATANTNTFHVRSAKGLRASVYGDRANARMIAQAPTLATDLADALDREAASLAREAALREAVETLAGVVERLADAMLREGTEQDGNWGFPAYRADVEWAKQTCANLGKRLATSRDLAPLIAEADGKEVQP